MQQLDQSSEHVLQSTEASSALHRHDVAPALRCQLFPVPRGFQITMALWLPEGQMGNEPRSLSRLQVVKGCCCTAPLFRCP